jgi:opacity protein-like surface antigen
MNRLLPTLCAGLALVTLAMSAANAADHRREYFDNRFNHGHYYPNRGVVYGALPGGALGMRYRGGDWYFQGGAWYRPYGPRYIVAAPPIGIGLRVLPPFYTTVWFGGIPYYYADGSYYVWRGEQQEYVVTDPPSNDLSTTPPPAATEPATQDTYAYPKSGQSEAQQSTDRYECHSWAAQQSGFDPTQPLGGVSADQSTGKRNDYLRAERACLTGRGYSVN